MAAGDTRSVSIGLAAAGDTCSVSIGLVAAGGQSLSSLSRLMLVSDRYRWMTKKFLEWCMLSEAVLSLGRQAWQAPLV